VGSLVIGREPQTSVVDPTARPTAKAVSARVTAAFLPREPVNPAVTI
jgi:hypothetical protein